MMGGIYIKDMKMPKDCMNCPACQGDECWMVEGRPQVPDVLNKRPKWCPLVEVPAHGRLIDGDELSEGCDEPYWCRWKSEIDDAPTIIPADEEDSDG